MITHLLIFLALGIAIRNLVVYGLQYLGTEKLKDIKTIYRVPLRKGQSRREFFQPLYGTIMDAAFLLALYHVGLLNFVAGNIYQYLIFLGVHAIVTEPLYYWYHRVLHLRKFYKKHHIYHHWSVITTPATSFTFTATERFSYTLLFGIPIIVASLCGVLSMGGLLIYLVMFDAINALGHLNHEIFPHWYGKSKLRYLFYTPTFHSQHHAKFNKNYALYMPVYDKIWGTYEPSTDAIFDSVIANESLERVHRSKTTT